MKVEEGAVTTLLLTVTSHWTLTTVKCQPTQRKEALGSCEMAGLQFSVKRKKERALPFQMFSMGSLAYGYVKWVQLKRFHWIYFQD